MQETNLENICRQILGAVEDSLSWQWDSRFKAVLAEVYEANRDKIHTILQTHLNTVWDTSNINKAPDAVKAISRFLGGFRAGQVLFTSDPLQDNFLFCAWWPWGSDEVISIRLAPFSRSLTDEEKDELIKLFRSWFNV